ncbi:hypothetical protein DFH09DRAFT_1283642 [Mycena vulgaris]|nr:hypothetical protein DFH09DRAFT_1283642 [Mycena vulgaris]
MSSPPTRTIFRNFCISLDDVPQTLMIDVIVSSEGEIQLDARSKDPLTGRRTILDVRTLGAIPVASSRVADTSTSHTHPRPTVANRIHDEPAVPPPAYSRYTPLNAQPIPPSDPEPHLPQVPAPLVHPEPGHFEYGPHMPLLPPRSPVRRTLREIGEVIQRGELDPQILIEVPEELTFPLNLSGRRRKYGEDEDNDEDEEHYAKRGRISWGPWSFFARGIDFCIGMGYYQ